MGTDGTCSASTCRSGSEIVIMNPRIKLRKATTQALFICVRRMPIRSPMGVMAISAPSVKNIMPRTSRTPPIKKAIRMPGGMGAMVKHSKETIPMTGITAPNDSFNFSSNFCFNFA